MKTPPLISIITPSYNQAEFIEATLQSVLQQRYPHIEYIVVDGLSTDGTTSILEKYRHQLSHLIIEKDKGQTDAINKGFKLAKGELVGWINSDDILYEDCVERIVQLYEQHKEQGVIFYNNVNDMLDRAGNVTQTYNKTIPNRAYLLNDNYALIQQGSFYKRSVVEKVGYLNDRIQYCMDLDLWLKLLQHGNIHYLNIDKPTAGFRRWEAAKTSTGGIQFLNDIQNVLQQNKYNRFSRNASRLYIQKLKFQIKKHLHVS
jgi:glycosyltransferase involved in cell wall biosynthesis